MAALAPEVLSPAYVLQHASRHATVESSRLRQLPGDHGAHRNDAPVGDRRSRRHARIRADEAVVANANAGERLPRRPDVDLVREDRATDAGDGRVVADVDA